MYYIHVHVLVECTFLYCNMECPMIHTCMFVILLFSIDQSSPVRIEPTPPGTSPQATPPTTRQTPPISPPPSQPQQNTVTFDPATVAPRSPNQTIRTKPVFLQSSVTSIAPVSKGKMVSPKGKVTEIPHLVKFSIDLRSIHNLKMDPQHKCYLRLDNINKHLVHVYIGLKAYNVY